MVKVAGDALVTKGVGGKEDVRLARRHDVAKTAGGPPYLSPRHGKRGAAKVVITRRRWLALLVVVM